MRIPASRDMRCVCCWKRINDRGVVLVEKKIDGIERRLPFCSKDCAEQYRDNEVHKLWAEAKTIQEAKVEKLELFEASEA